MYSNWDPYSGKRIYLEASGGSLSLKSVVNTITKEAALPDELYRFNPASDTVVDTVDKGTEDIKLFLGAKSGFIMPAHSATHAMFRTLDAVQYAPHSEIDVEEHGIRLAARIRNAYSSVPLDALGWPDAIRLSAAHYNTPEKIDSLLKSTASLQI